MALHHPSHKLKRAQQRFPVNFELHGQNYPLICLTKLRYSASTDGPALLSSATFPQALFTVVWCLPPNALPISE